MWGNKGLDYTNQKLYIHNEEFPIDDVKKDLANGYELSVAYYTPQEEVWFVITSRYPLPKDQVLVPIERFDHNLFQDIFNEQGRQRRVMSLAAGAGKSWLTVFETMTTGGSCTAKAFQIGESPRKKLAELQQDGYFIKSVGFSGQQAIIVGQKKTGLSMEQRLFVGTSVPFDWINHLNRLNAANAQEAWMVTSVLCSNHK